MNMPLMHGGAAPQRGFTLLELLVAMVLLSMVVVGLGSVMSTVSQTQERVDMRLDRMDHQRVTVGFLRAVLGQVSALRRVGGMRQQGLSQLFFEGGSQSMQWLGVMPARFGAGGLTHFQLAVEGSGNETSLTLRFVPWQGQDVVPDWGQAQAYVLDRNIKTFTLSYQNARLGAQHWQPRWGMEPGNDRELPSAIQIELQTAAGTWPLIVVAVHVPATSNLQVNRGASLGGGEVL